MHKLPVVFIVIGITLIALSLTFLFLLFPTILKKKISEQAQLVNGSETWKKWQSVPIPVFQKLYIFNTTNPGEVKMGAKPNLQELGPYVYQHKREKVNIQIDSENDTLTYQHKDTYFYRPDLSNGSLEDKITVLNIPLLGAMYKGLLEGGATLGMVQNIVLEQFPNEDIFSELTVDQFLFGGVHVPMIAEMSSLSRKELLPNNTFGLYYGRNGSESPSFVIHAGVKSPGEYGRVIGYDGKPSLELFEEDGGCAGENEIEGYDGTTMPPFLTKDRTFKLFIPTLCRQLKFAFEGELELGGIPGFRFRVPRPYLASPKVNPENSCFCSRPGNDYEKCLKGGAWELGPCRGGTPMVMSFPHFYQGAPEYLEGVEGLSPEEDKHEMVIVLEPTAAIALKVAIRVQMNFALTPTKKFPKLKKISEVIYPIFWMDQGVTLPPPVIQMIKDKLIKTQEYVKVGSLFGVGLGLVFVVAALVIFWCIASSVKNKKYKPEQGKSNKNANGSYREQGETSFGPHGDSKDKYSLEEAPFLANGGSISAEKRSPKLIPVVAPVVSYIFERGEVVGEGEMKRKGTQKRSHIVLFPHLFVGAADEQPEVEEKQKNKDEGEPGVNKSTNVLNEFSSSNSVNNDLKEIESTLKYINEAVSSYAK